MNMRIDAPLQDVQGILKGYLEYLREVVVSGGGGVEYRLGIYREGGFASV